MGLRTRWADDVDPDAPLPEYPRPQLVRTRWTNLNGRWAVTVVDSGGTAVVDDDEIIVPFPIGSDLSGIDHVLQPDETLTVGRSFRRPDLGDGERLRLHFGAVDWACEAVVNGTVVGRHEGGFDPFWFDITDALVDGAEQRLDVIVTDPTDTGPQPLGKQTLQPFAIQYTAYAGIW